MSLFGAKKQEPLKEILKRAKGIFEEKMSASSAVSTTSSSHSGGLLDRITRPLSSNDGVATTLEIANELNELDCEDQQRAFHGTQEYERLKAQEEREDFETGLARARIEDDLRRLEDSQETPRLGSGQLPSDLDDMRAYSDLTGKTGVTGITRYGSDDSLGLLSPPPTTSYGGSLLGLPPNTLPLDPCWTPRASAGLIARRYIQLEENTSHHAEKEEEMEETLKVDTPIPRKLEISDDSDDARMEVEWRDEEPYMTPTKKGKKCNEGKGVKRPVTPERPSPNMLQTTSRRKLEADWGKPAENLASEDEPADLGKFIGEYLWNTNGLRDFTVGQEKYNVEYVKWCVEQGGHVAARQNHTDAAVMSVQKISNEIKEQIELSREYDEDRPDRLDNRLSKIEKRLARIAPVNMAKTIENAMKDCMEQMVEQVTDQVVGKLEKWAEKEKREEIRRGKQVEATPENNGMSDIKFELGATFSEEENEKVAKVLERMDWEEQELEASKHAPVIPLGEKGQEFPRFTPSGQVTLAKRPGIAPAVPQQKKKEVKKPEVKEVPKGPKAGEKKRPEVKKPEIKKPEKKLEERRRICGHRGQRHHCHQ